MKCPNCGEEIVLAKLCPYCGHRIPETAEASETTRKKSEGVRGRFRGSLRKPPFDHGRITRGVNPVGVLRAVYRLMRDPQAGVMPKISVILAVLYLLHPLDVIPDILIGLGWLDDVAVLAFVWRYLSDKLREYLP